MRVHRLFRLTSFSVLLLAMLIAAGGGGLAARAQDDSGGGPDWELTGLSDPVVRLFTPASGAFFAQTAMSLNRSDDSGTTWRSFPLGPATRILDVDPTNHTILFAAGPDGVYRTNDDAASWQLIFPYDQNVGRNALALAVSPADHNVVYLGVTMNPSISSDFRFFRSQDGGATWQQLEEHHFSLCGWGVAILQPHPTDAGRVFRTAQCSAGRDFGGSLDQSTTAGQKWTALWKGDTSESMGYPKRLEGGMGAAPGLFYLAVNRDRRVGGSVLYRSDDDGATWNPILAYHGGGTPGFGGDPQVPSVEFGGLAYDPSNPDHVYAGRQVYPSYSDPPDGGAVAASVDGGMTWSDLGRQDIGAVFDLALGIDGRNLYAATDQGVWRLRLDGSQT